MKSKNVKIVVTVPTSHADRVRERMAQAGAGIVGNYSHASFSTKGIGRFKPMNGAHPAIGKTGTLESVEEERIETICSRDTVERVIQAIKNVHPYEEIALDVYPIES